MKQELKNDLIATYWAVKDASRESNLTEIRKELAKALHWLKKYVNEADELKDLPNKGRIQ